MNEGSPPWARARLNVGVVAGPVSTTTVRRRFWGFPVLLGTAAVVTGVTAARIVAGDVDGRALVAGLLGPAALVAAVRLVRWLAVDLRQRAGLDVTRRWMAPATISVRRFRVQPPAGNARWYVLEGDLPTGVPPVGAIVRVTGRRARDGHLVARELDILATLEGPVIRTVAGRPAPEYTATRWLSHASHALAAVLAVSTALAPLVT